MSQAAFAPNARLSVRDLACHRGQRPIFAGVSFELAPGEGLLVSGRNGAGKTTLLRALAGLLRPSSGRAEWVGDGPDIAVPDRAHFIGHADGVKLTLTVQENIAFWTEYLATSWPGSSRPSTSPGVGIAAVDARVKPGHDESEERQIIEAAMEALALEPLADVPARYLSAGQKRRLGLSRLLAARRPVWLLDEPTHALDAGSVASLARLVEAHLGHGGMAVIASHVPLGVDLPRTLHLGPAA